MGRCVQHRSYPRDRVRIDQFRALESLRVENGASPSTATQGSAADNVVTWFAFGQLVITATAAAAFAVVFDAMWAIPLSRLAIVAAFAVGAAVLMAAERHTRRVQALLGTTKKSAARDLMHMIDEERPPRLRWRTAVPGMYFATVD